MAIKGQDALTLTQTRIQTRTLTLTLTQVGIKGKDARIPATEIAEIEQRVRRVAFAVGPRL